MTEDKLISSPQSPEQNTTKVDLGYSSPNEVSEQAGTMELALYGDIHRDPVSLDAQIKNILEARDALSTLYQVVGSDYRYVPKDRSAYQAYRRMRSESANQDAWNAQQAYFSWLSQNDPYAFLILDPIISVHPDQMIWEVFSKDEGTYAKLSMPLNNFDITGEPSYGTTNIDFSESFNQGIQQFRSYRDTRLRIQQQAVTIKTESAGSNTNKVIEKEINVPDSWIRGFLQVQSSALLPSEKIRIAPIDFYNLLRHLRLNKDEKGKRRGIRLELVPGEFPRIVLEPWELVLETSSSPYQGKHAKVVRIWGRRRLMMVQRLMPYIDDIELHVQGSGLPTFWIFKCQSMTLSIGLTGFTAADWSKSLSFDLLLPRINAEDEAADQQLQKIVKHLSTKWVDSKGNIAKAIDCSERDLLPILQRGCQLGQIIYDIAENTYRLRPLTRTPLDFKKLEYRNTREKQAYDLMLRKSAVSITQENRIYGSGLEITGKVNVTEDKREYRPQFLLTEDNNVSKAECTCTHFRDQGLKNGPCEHLIALRLEYARLDKKRSESGRSRKTITVETKTFSRRKQGQEQIQQLTLNKKRVEWRWGLAGEKLKLQRMMFNNIDQARSDYLSRIDKILQDGFLDATMGF